MRRFMLATLAIGFAATFTSVSCADWHSFVERSRLDWHRNNAWPQPFVARDRIATCTPFVKMAYKGWCRESTLTSVHFDPETNLLTEAGQRRVKQIVTAHPPENRTVFVVQGFSDRDTSARIDSVQQSVARFVGRGPLPGVRAVTIEPRASTAYEVQMVEEKFRETLPAPRIPDADNLIGG